jgi:exodeoxyribonuclease VII small subunit
MAEPKFEKDLEKLEQIVESLEEGGQPLDTSLKKFEEGIKLAQRCEKALSTAEKKIEKLIRNAEGELDTEPLDEEEEAPASKKKKKAPKTDDGVEDGELPF